MGYQSLSTELCSPKTHRNAFYSLARRHDIADVLVLHADFTDAAILESKLYYKNHTADSPHPLCIADYLDRKLESPLTDEITALQPISLLNFDSTRFAFRVIRDRIGLVQVIESILRESIATGKIAE